MLKNVLLSISFRLSLKGDNESLGERTLLTRNRTDLFVSRIL